MNTAVIFLCHCLFCRLYINIIFTWYHSQCCSLKTKRYVGIRVSPNIKIYNNIHFYIAQENGQGKSGPNSDTDIVLATLPPPSLMFCPPTSASHSAFLPQSSALTGFPAVKVYPCYPLSLVSYPANIQNL